MIHSQNLKFAVLKGPVTVATNASNSSAILDTKDWEWGTFTIILPPSTATDSANKLGYCRIADCDTTNGTFVDVSGFIGTTATTAVSTGTAVEFVLGTHGDTSVGGSVVLDVDLRQRKRYIKVNTQAAASHQTIAVTAMLSRGAKSPTSTTERNVVNFVVG